MPTMQTIAQGLGLHEPAALRSDQVDAFLARMVQAIPDSESVGIFDALGRVMAQDLISNISVPPHDNSAMDGYAFCGAVLERAPTITLRLAGTVLAGTPWQGQTTPETCLRIMTGAVMPEGFDTVVPQELAEVLESTPPCIRFASGALRPGENRRRAGEDLRQGQAALSKGELLTPAALGLAASLGISELLVRRRLRVAYFSTGDEILSVGEPPRAGAVYDSNRYTVFGLLKRLGCEVVDLGVVRDDPQALEAALVRAATQADAVITSGGVSVGEADHTKALMQRLGDVAFWKIAMRPGRPMAAGLLSHDKISLSPYWTGAGSYQNMSASRPSTVFFGLPGNPVAVMVTFLAFVRPALLRMMGCTSAAPPLLQARSAQAIRKKPGRTEYQRGIVSTAQDGALQVAITGNQGSGVLSSMVRANGLIVLPHDRGDVQPGETVSVMMFDGVG